MLWYPGWTQLPACVCLACFASIPSLPKGAEGRGGADEAGGDNQINYRCRVNCEKQQRRRKQGNAVWPHPLFFSKRNQQVDCHREAESETPALFCCFQQRMPIHTSWGLAHKGFIACKYNLRWWGKNHMFEKRGSFHPNKQILQLI